MRAVSALSTRFSFEARATRKILRGCVLTRLIAHSECKTMCNTSLGSQGPSADGLFQR